MTRLTLWGYGSGLLYACMGFVVYCARVVWCAGCLPRWGFSVWVFVDPIFRVCCFCSEEVVVVEVCWRNMADSGSYGSVTDHLRV